TSTPSSLWCLNGQEPLQRMRLCSTMKTASWYSVVIGIIRVQLSRTLSTTRNFFQPAYSVFGANASYTLPGDHFTITGGVTNLTDKRYIQGGFVDLDVAGLATANFFPPTGMVPQGRL
ncbi:TonB-dependent receptor, partial [Sphingobium sp. Ant17]|uniref:TonB-dependent receptor n=1 Tax=Sphingobium sp. Ant17 TaxID=1461752 RepID=UPI001F294EF3